MNVYDIRHERNLYYIFPVNAILPENQFSFHHRVAVFVNLFYFDDLDWYFKYLYTLPEAIDLYIISSDARILKRAKNQVKERRGFFTIKKINRGRDISALLVAAKPYFELYEYVCFIHDKKWRTLKDKNMVQRWLENLWGPCCLQSHIFIMF